MEPNIDKGELIPVIQANAQVGAVRVEGIEGNIITVRIAIKAEGTSLHPSFRGYFSKKRGLYT